MKNFDVGNISLEARSMIQAIKTEIEKRHIVRPIKWDDLFGRTIGEKTLLL